MMKSFFFMLYPMILNYFILLIFMIPMKKIKFHPMLLLITLILTTIIITNKMNFMFKSWMPFILFLIVIGGLMIIYMYITSLANNNFLMIKLSNLYMLTLKFLIILIPLIFLMKKFNLMMWNNQDSWNLMKFMMKKNEMNFSEMYNLNYLSMMMMMIYLYISMICIMNICYKFNSPLRQLYFYE